MPINFNNDPSDPANNNKPALGSAIPEHAVATAGNFGRCEPLITPELLKSRFLKGIPLVTPVTKEKYTDDDLKDFIVRAVANIELTAQIDIFEVQRNQKFPFDRHLYQQWVHVEIPNKPIKSLQEMKITTADGVDVFSMPNLWIESSNFIKGLINVIPISPAFASIGAQTSAAQGGAIFLTFIGQQGWIPAYWRIKWVSGFGEQAIPLVVNEMIGCEAAQLLLSELAATHKYTSHALGIDGLSQTVGGPGPQVYQQRIADLEAKKQELLKRIKKLFGNGIMVSNI